MGIDSDIGILEAIISTLLLVGVPLLKIIYNKMNEKIDGLEEALKETTTMLNTRIDHRRDNLNTFVDSTRTELADINTKLTRILTKLEDN